MREKKEKIVEKQLKAGSYDNFILMYLNEISRVPLLSRDDEEKYARAAAAGNKAAREKLLNANLRFVVNVAKKYQGLGLPLEDLISEGNVGLVTAVDRFNIDKGCRFISYAVWWIRQSIITAICEKSKMIRLPQNRAAELIKIEKARKMLEKPMSFNEEVREIAQFLEMDDDHVKDLISISREMLSLEDPVSSDKNSQLVDLLVDNQYTPPDQHVINNFMEEDIEKLLVTLEEDEAFIIRNHYGLGSIGSMTLKELGEKFNLSKERIRQIEIKALSRLQNPLRSEKLDMYVA